ncbi:DUF445 family protein [Tissierella praeacuta]|uniref:DUF445 family protein n=1 Tax=Tissierella praeacuta TaxID=43131 RepID=UPI00333E80DE
MKILIPIIVGAIIGYFTNWLAIKMLFRPHYEKRIMGIKIPFTPGLIPKERDRIARSIGETVGGYLLSPETIVEALSNKETDENIKSWLENRANNLKDNKQSIKEFLLKLLDDKYNKFIYRFEKKINNIIISQIRGEQFKSLIFKSIADKINKMDAENIYKVIDERLRDLLCEISSSKDLTNGLINLMRSKLEDFAQDDRKLAEIIPDDILTQIDQYIDENQDKIGNSIKEIFKDPVIQQKLKNSISQLVSQNMSKLIIAFISPDIISDKAFHVIEKYINSEEANKNIVMIIKSSINKLLQSRISAIIPNVADNIGEKGVSKIGDILTEYISNENNQNALLEFVMRKLRDSETGNREKIINYLNTNIDTILNSAELDSTISNIVKNMIDNFLNKPIYSMAEKIDENMFGNIYNIIRNIFNKFLINELPPIIELFNISRIVEDKINSYDVDFAEELILEIANKELKAITWLGALLGGFLGILTPLIQMLY